MTACAVVEELSRADGSTGWTSMILNTTLFSCWLEPNVTRELLATDPELGMAGLFAPIGHTEPAGDGAVRLTGRGDLHAGSCHIFFSNNHSARGGQAILGQPTKDWLM
jgi:hypothetical protein